ncbi:MAG: hypothetical protein JST22_14510 [Bacteroidetes bacterium]|nr:hypothetical protein [Bacteroidota bacterium]
MPCLTTGAPIIFGMRPVIALVDWTVPASLDGVRAFMRVRVRARGAGDYYFTRTDDLRVTKWRQPPDAFYIEYMKYLGQDYTAKPTSPSMPPKGPMLLSVHDAGADDNVAIDFTAAPHGGATSVAIYDEAGRLLFYPYSSPSSNGEHHQTSYRFESSGMYLVSLLHDNHVVATVPMTIAR